MQDTNDVIAARVMKAATEIMGDYGRLVTSKYDLLVRMRQIGKSGTRRGLAIDILSDLLPTGADPTDWMQWLKGGGSPREKLRAPQFDASSKPSSRKISEAAAHTERVSSSVADARDRLAAAKQRVAEAEQALVEAEEAEERAENLAKGAALWAYLREVHQIANPAFSMGPAWSIMRIVSGYLQTDAEWEARLTPEERAHLEKHRRDRAEQSKEMLQILDAMSGHPAFELLVFEGLYKLVKGFADEATERAAEARRSGSPLAKIDDVGAVVDGIDSA